MNHQHLGLCWARRRNGHAHHVEELLEQALGGLALAPQDLIEVGIADALLEHLLQTPRHVGPCTDAHHVLLSPHSMKTPKPSHFWGVPPPQSAAHLGGG